MLVKTTLERHGCTGHRVLQAGNGAIVALTGRGLAGLLTVVLNQVLQFATASIQRASKIQRNVSGMVVVRLAKFVRPVTEQLPLISNLFWNRNRISVHIYSTKLRTWMHVACFCIPLLILTRHTCYRLTRG